MRGKIVLVTGGARSGKSTFAEHYAAAAGEPVVYIATAQVGDEEMRLRVELHQRRRPAEWLTIEAPVDADRAIAQAAQTAKVVLFDCLTLYTSNLLLAAATLTEPAERQRYIIGAIDKLIEAAQASQATVIFVTNEVGMGIVPDNALAREYRDVAGKVNQRVAAAADEVYLVVCGLAVDIKQLAVRTGGS